MKAIIFGASGQDGFYTGELLRREHIETVKISRSGGGDLIGDVADRAFVESVVKDQKPDYIFHLAANSTTAHNAVYENHQTIATGTLNILEAADRHSRDSRIFLSGSAMQFENTGAPIDENTPFAALSPYSVSRIQSVYAGRYYRSRGLKVYAGYFFNHDSPRRTTRHINQKIALAAKTGELIEIGDINVKKEFNFAGDMVEAVWRLVNQNAIYEAVIGSGAAHSIAEWLDLCYGAVDKNWREYVTIKENFQAEYRVLISNPALIKSLGWRPKLDIKDLARLMMNGAEI